MEHERELQKVKSSLSEEISRTQLRAHEMADQVRRQHEEDTSSLRRQLDEAQSMNRARCGDLETELSGERTCPHTHTQTYTHADE